MSAKTAYSGRFTPTLGFTAMNTSEFKTHYSKSKLYKRLLKQFGGKKNPGFEHLAASLESLLSRAEPLYEQINIDLKGMTNHGRKHVFALVDYLDLITDDGCTLNPIEFYILMVAFMLHDAAQCRAAYAETGEAFDALVAKSGKNEPDFLRLNHAKQAAELLKIEWNLPNGDRLRLMDSTPLRDGLADIIGEVCESHWWYPKELEERYKNTACVRSTMLGTQLGFSDCNDIDVFKLAVLLRLCDASQCDARRTPHFQRAIALRDMSPESASHWDKQQNIAPVNQVVERRLLYRALSPFRVDQHQVWWDAYDMLCIVEREFQATGAVIKRVMRWRKAEKTTMPKFELAVEGVLDIDTPEAMAQHLNTDGTWSVIDTRVTIPQPLEIVKSLGGTQLYGDQVPAPWRELLQNAVEASCLAKAALGDAPDGHSNVPPVLFTVTPESTFNDEDKTVPVTVTCRDFGIGMSMEALKTNLLSFGTSSWRQDAKNQDIEDYDDPIGRFGIGFFSVFMMSNQVTIRTRTHDDDQVLTLKFTHGLDRQPLLTRAKDRTFRPGTEIIIHSTQLELKNNFSQKSKLSWAYDWLRGQVLSPEHAIECSIDKDSCTFGTTPFLDESKYPWLEFPVKLQNDINGRLFPAYEHYMTQGVASNRGFSVGRVAGCLGRIEALPKSASRDDVFSLSQFSRGQDIENWFRIHLKIGLWDVLNAASLFSIEPGHLDECWTRSKKRRICSSFRSLCKELATNGGVFISRELDDKDLEHRDSEYLEHFDWFYDDFRRLQVHPIEFLLTHLAFSRAKDIGDSFQGYDHDNNYEDTDPIWDQSPQGYVVGLYRGQLQIEKTTSATLSILTRHSEHRAAVNAWLSALKMPTSASSA